MQLTDQTAIVTGAAGAIGSAVAKALAAAGANLCLADHKSSAETADAVRRLGRQAIDQPTDVARRADIEALVARAAQSFGRIDILVNAAGVTSFGTAAALEESEWDRVLAVNLKGVFFCCQAVIPHMRAKRRGRIVNIGSIIGKNGGNARPWVDPAEQKVASNVAYGISKSGVHIMTIFLAKELAAEGITVNAVAPGPILSAMSASFPAEKLKALIPVGRMGTPEEVAAAVAFLASESAGFITGEILDVNGGMWPD